MEYWRRLHNEELYNMYLGDQIKNEMGGVCGTYGARRGVYRVLVM